MKKQQLACMGLLCSIFWMACSGNKSHYDVSAADTISNTNNTGVSVKQEKLVKTADMRFKVRNVERVSEDVAALTLKHNGIVMHHTVQSTIQKSEDIPLANDSVRHVTSYNTTAEMLVRVPSDQMEEFMNEVSKMAVYVDARNMDIQDKTLDYLSGKMKLENRQQMLKDQKTGKIAVSDSTEFLSTKDNIIDRKISALRTDAAVRYSTIALSIYQSNTISKDIIANDDPSAYRLPFFSRLGLAFERGWLVLDEFLLVVINLWPFILAAGAGWLIVRYLKKKNIITTTPRAPLVK